MSPAVNKHSLYLRLHQAVREFPRYNQFLNEAHNLPIKLVEAHILVEIDSYPGITVGELSKLLDYELTALSKSLNSLCSKKLVGFIPDTKDKRIKKICLTAAGFALLKKFDQLANQQLINFNDYALLTEYELDRIKLMLEQLADALLAPLSKSRKNEHLMRLGIRRLTRSFGLLSNKSMITNMNALEWQLLLTICEHNGKFLPSELVVLLKVNKVAISLALKKLMQEGLIKKVLDKVDTRSYYLLATNKAFKTIKNIEITMAMRLSVYTKLVEKDLLLLEQWIRGAAMFFYLDMQGLSFQRLSATKLLNQARILQVKKYLESEAQEIPAVLYHESNYCYGLFNQSRVLVAACEYRKTSSSVELLNIYFSKTLHPDSVRSFILSALNSTSAKLNFQNLPLELKSRSHITSGLGRLFI